MRTSFLTLNSALVFAAATEGTESAAPTPAPNRVLEALFDEAKVKAIKEVMKDREVFESLEAAGKKLEAAAGKTENFYGLPIGIKGTGEDGSVDESIYEGQRVALAYVGAKKEKATGIKAIVMYPVASIEQFLDSTEGRDFLDKIAVKEMSLVAFRNFREASTLYEFVNGVNAAPANAAEYATESKRGLDTDAFDALWLGFKATVKDKMPAIHDLLPPKKMFLDALRSKAYAESEDNTKALEAKGLFVKFGQVLVSTGKTNKDEKGNPAPLDTSAIESWLEMRNELTLERDGGKPKDFSVLDTIGDAFNF